MHSSACRIEARLVGTPCLVVDGTPRALERHDAALIALLAIEGPMTRARMATWLWPDTPQPQARSHLRQRLLRLRRTAGVDWLEADGTLRLADGCVDLHRLAALAADPGTALRGELLAGLDYSDVDGLDDWVRNAREQWRRRRSDLLSAEASAHELAGRFGAALPFAERIVREEPLLEAAHRRVIRLHYLCGDRAQSLLAARACVEALDRELGVAPDAETSALIADIEAVRAPVSRQPTPEPLALRRPPRMIGRDAQWQHLERAAADRSALLVTGEAGIGKTRLLDDFCRSRSDALIVTGLAGDDRLPYALLARLLRTAMARHGQPAREWVRSELAHLLPSLGPAAVGAVDPLRLAGAFADEVQRWHGCGLRVLVVDDLHFADLSTLQVLLPVVAASSAGAGLAWTLAARTDEIPAEAEAWATKAAPRGVRRIELAPLQQQDVVELLRSVAIAGLDPTAAAPALLQHTGGNPFFLLETLLAWMRRRPKVEEGVPRFPVATSAQTLLKRHLERLSPLPMRLAQVMALAGQDFDDRLASTAVLDASAHEIGSAWSALNAHRLLVNERLAHDLLRQALVDAIPPPTGRCLHGRIAEALDDGRSTAAPARIAEHWAAAGRLERAAPRWVDAAKQAEQASRFDEMQALYARAAEAWARLGRRAEHREALQAMVTIAVRRQDLSAAARIAEEVTALAESDEARAWALDRQCEVALFGREDSRAEALATQALSLAAHSADEILHFHLDRKLAVALAYAGRHEDAATLMESLRSWAQAHPDDYNTRVWISDRASLFDMAGRPADARRQFEALLLIEQQANDDFAVYQSRCVLAQLCYVQGQLAAAVTGYEEALREAQHLGDAYTLRNPRGATRRAPVWRDANRHGTALAWLEEAGATLARGNNHFLADRCDDQLALSHFELGNAARAAALVQPDPASAHPEARATRAFVRARLARLRGGSFDVPTSFGGHCPRRLVLPVLLEASHALAATEALAARRDIEGEANTHGLHGLALHASVWAATAAVDGGQRDEAETRIRSALERLNSLHPTGASRAEVEWTAAAVLRRLGDVEGAQAIVRQAAHALHDCADVPPAFRSRFLKAHPVHRQIIAAAQAMPPAASRASAPRSD